MNRKLRLALILSPILPLGLYYGIYYIIFLGLLSLTKVLYYAMTFNDCKEAAESLKLEVKEARTDLAKKGFKFVT